MSKLFVISGPSGSGKGTIIEALMKMPALNLAWPKSYTTRPERESDKTENHYIFVNIGKFKELEQKDEIFESNFYNDNWYGSSKSEIEKLIADDKTVIKEVDVNGGEASRKTFPEAIPGEAAKPCKITFPETLLVSLFFNVVIGLV